ncbi:hypothetical protein [Marinitoga sp. 38H-ov]|uniref:hypothetical protein n=1 Tax=Marinitoga sp. 38H-ov TaxID=1755814 RepID=UPI0013EC4A1B|nr:hypothetical protein [Marinitoga sp. 38H-ov]KAF2956220.1 hypothetical protein AS160_07005 [Marinitoga sp. 38H-ov]
MNYYICEIKDSKNNLIKIALVNEIIGVSSKFVKKNIEGNFLGYSKFKDKLYPVITIPENKEFILKFFLIYNSFAFGVSSIIKNIEVSEIEKFNSETLEQFPHLRIFSGYFELDNEEIFVFNVNKVYEELPANFVVKNVEKDKEKKEDIINPNVFVIDNKYSILRNKIINIIDSSTFCSFKHGEFDGFIEYKNKIYNVIKTSEKAKWIVVGEKVALLCEKIDFVYGEIFDSQDKKFLRIDNKTLPILE